MQREEYIELVTESSFKDESMILFDKFEQYSSETNTMAFTVKHEQIASRNIAVKVKYLLIFCLNCKC